MDIEQAMRAMAPLPEDEERLAFGLEDDAWPPPLTATDRLEARAIRFAAWISDEEWRAGQRAEDRGQKPEGRGQKPEGGGAEERRG